MNERTIEANAPRILPAITDLNRAFWTGGATGELLIAIVELDEQADLRLPTNIVHCDADALYVGMPVRVLFEPHGNVFVPVFEPTPASVTA